MSNSSKNLTQKSVAGIDTSKSAKKIGLATLKSNVDELDIDKLKLFQLI